MEKFQMLFPYSSATSPIIRNNSDYFPKNYEGGHNSSGNLLGLNIDDNNGVLSSVVPNNNNNHSNKDDEPIRSESASFEADRHHHQQRIKGTKKIRKPRYAFQTRSQVDILDDGYRWRKYGQKAVKNNKFPRSYYRCTYEGCNVKKQVQRLTKDEGIVVTTYEGIHSHPIQRPTDNFEHILKQMQIYTPF